MAMRDDDKIRCLVDLIFGKTIIPREATACLQADEFLRSLRIVLAVTGAVVDARFGELFDVYLNKTTYDEMYVRMVMRACLTECEYNQSKLNSFIRLCTLAKLASDKMLQIRGVDYSDLNPDIIMTLYNDEMRKSILRCGGFQKLYSYIHDHKYTKWRWNKIDIDLINSLNFANKVNALHEDLNRKFSNEIKEIKEENDFVSGYLIVPGEINRKSVHLTKLVLSNTLVRLPIIPSKPDTINKLVKSQQIEKTEATRRTKTAAEDEIFKAAWQEFLSFNSNSLVNQELETQKDFISGPNFNTSQVYDKTISLASVELPNRVVKLPNVLCEPNELKRFVESDQNETVEKAETTSRIEADAKHKTSEVPIKECWSSNSITNHEANEEDPLLQHENIIKEVFMYNSSKSSNHVNCNNPIRIKVDSVIDHMKETIESLIEILEEFDEE